MRGLPVHHQKYGAPEVLIGLPYGPADIYRLLDTGKSPLSFKGRTLNFVARKESLWVQQLC